MWGYDTCPSNLVKWGETTARRTLKTGEGAGAKRLRPKWTWPISTQRIDCAPTIPVEGLRLGSPGSDSGASDTLYFAWITRGKFGHGG